MRNFLASLVIGFVALGAGPSHATGNVLLPPSNGAAPTGNLGIVPQAEPKTDTPVPASQQDAKAPPPILPNAAPTPIPTVALPYTPIKPSNTPAMSAGGARTSGNRIQLPTHVIQMPETAPLQDPNDKSLPYSISVDLDPQYSFSAADIETINQRFGIPKDKIASSCTVALNGFIRTEKGFQIVNTGNSPHVDVHYDGRITNVSLRPQALCPAGTLPPNAGFITQVGNHYTMPLGSVSCQPPAQAAHQVVAVYRNGSGQCVYK